MSRRKSTLLASTFLSALALPLAAGAASPLLLVAHNFSGPPDGQNPLGGVTLAADGLLYGTTYYGGSYTYDPVDNAPGNGTIFSVGTNGAYSTSYSFTNLTQSFTNVDGRWPQVAFAPDTDGSLYGVAYYGGSNDDGTVFRYLPAANSFTTLHNFTGNTADPGGVRPSSALVLASDGYLYGTTDYGGSNAPNDGVVFKIAKNGSGFQVLHSFGATGGAELPKGRLLASSDGYLYGIVTSNSSGPGAIFRIAHDGSGFSVIHGLNYATEGGYYARAGFIPGLTEGSDGYLYGTTVDGGAGGHGTVFRMAHDGSGFTVLHTFSTTNSSGVNADGSMPRTSPIFGSDGNLYGATSLGGAHGYGVVYRMAANGGSYTVLRSFAKPGYKGHNYGGAEPMGDIAFGPRGRLCGTAYAGGKYGMGTAYCLQF
jgi:uncharacterized repeat protein (TIGR03803 family)